MDREKKKYFFCLICNDKGYIAAGNYLSQAEARSFQGFLVFRFAYVADVGAEHSSLPAEKSGVSRAQRPMPHLVSFLLTSYFHLALSYSALF